MSVYNTIYNHNKEAVIVDRRTGELYHIKGSEVASVITLDPNFISLNGSDKITEKRLIDLIQKHKK